LKVGQKLVSGPESQPEIGNTLPLSRVPLGTACIELRPGQGCIARSAGTFAQLWQRDGTIKMPSGETRLI
jgi:large subunit ribosomal protein L2